VTSLLLALLTACSGSEDSGAPPPPAPTDAILVADTGAGVLRLLDRASGEEVAEACLSRMMPGRCGDTDDARCLVFGVTHTADGEADRLGFVWGRQSDAGIPGQWADARITPDEQTVKRAVDVLRYPDDPALDAVCASTPDEDERCRFQMPHDARTLADGTWAVADTLNNRVVFYRLTEVDDAVADLAEVVGSLERDAPDNDGFWWPNALSATPDGLLVVTYKGTDPERGVGRNAGRIVAWDVSEPTAPRRAWVFPPEGGLAAVHGGLVVTDPDGATLLVYGHAFGASEDADAGDHGSVGVARLDPGAEPVYLGDFVLAEDTAEAFGFVREAELTADGVLVITDSGCENAASGCTLAPRVMTAPWPGTPPPAGRSGSHSADHAEQVFLPLPGAEALYTGGLRFPFEADALDGSAIGGALARARCEADDTVR
jgi:hypothetical protein